MGFIEYVNRACGNVKSLNREAGNIIAANPSWFNQLRLTGVG
jgi:hypothetical protein